MNLLLFSLFTVAAVHIGVPFVYFLIMSRFAAKHDYGLKHSNISSKDPTITIVVPTYNEAQVIAKKLENITKVIYPKNLIQLLVVDGASEDDTVDISKKILKSTGLDGNVIVESSRNGKSFGLNLALKQASGDLFCISDAECLWDINALKNAVSYFTDSNVGSVSGVHEILGSRNNLSVNVEDSYRSIYRMLRIAESKIHSTPIAEGEIQVIRRNVLEGFDTNVGGDDTSAALKIIEKGFRAITAEDVIFYEPTPTGWHSRLTQKIRRGQHILQAFLHYRKLLFRKSIFWKIIFPMEFFLYIINPILFPLFITLLFIFAISNPIVMIIATIGIIGVTIFRSTRSVLATYLSNNITMLAALIQELRGNKQLTWTKIQDTRTIGGSNISC